MKKRMSKAVSILLVATMVMGMTACGKKEETKVDKNVKKFEIFAGISALSPDNADKPIIQQMNKAMGVTIDWNCISGDTLTEKKNLVLNSGTDMPDAFMGASLSDSEIITNGSNGVFIPLEKYINEDTMPNLSKLVKERPDLLATCTMPDGHIYTLPTISEMGFKYSDGNDYYIGAIPQFMGINKKWLKAVGMKMPTTIDELHDVLVAFKEKDCNGNGDPNDEIPLSFEWGHWCAGMTTLFSAFGFTDYNADHRAIKNGKVYFQASTENYKKAMEYFHQWYKEGLIDIESFSQDDSQYIAKGSGKDEKLGVFSWWEIPEVAGKHADEYEYLTFLSGKDGTLGVNLNEQGTTGHDRFAVTSNCKNPELLMKWIDQAYDPVLSMQIIYGPIGKYFESKPDKNGVYVETKDAGGDLKAKTELWAPNRQLSTDFGKYYYMEDRAKKRLDDTANIWFKNVKNFEYYPSVVYSLEETETINNNISDIKDYVSETSANWIIKGGVEEGWDTYINQLNSMGVNDVVAAWQSAYDRYQKETK
ncbi:type 2 periplasmic-binding domain-containing protein [Anaeromicropila herbilytica]|uniref:Sugar ABC transporter substrate-binding protein n=1 Tax=Anaeromicropila herbilytica TaxID=2785025 RepID=A0A7R7EIC5_9FIRM|nr:extracellular solute-binding protein [Anaeromicropila herbilytica]BCN29280.1 sugar ABC transporter substrate-binding protein [Anaeromicropila herbilytica]